MVVTTHLKLAIRSIDGASLADHLSEKSAVQLNG